MWQWWGLVNRGWVGWRRNLYFGEVACFHRTSCFSLT